MIVRIFVRVRKAWLALKMSQISFCIVTQHDPWPDSESVTEQRSGLMWGGRFGRNIKAAVIISWLSVVFLLLIMDLRYVEIKLYYQDQRLNILFSGQRTRSDARSTRLSRRGARHNLTEEKLPMQESEPRTSRETRRWWTARLRMLPDMLRSWGDRDSLHWTGSLDTTDTSTTALQKWVSKYMLGIILFDPNTYVCVLKKCKKIILRPLETLKIIDSKFQSYNLRGL